MKGSCPTTKSQLSHLFSQRLILNHISNNRSNTKLGQNKDMNSPQVAESAEHRFMWSRQEGRTSGSRFLYQPHIFCSGHLSAAEEASWLITTLCMLLSPRTGRCIVCNYHHPCVWYPRGHRVCSHKRLVLSSNSLRFKVWRDMRTLVLGRLFPWITL